MPGKSTFQSDYASQRQVRWFFYLAIKSHDAAGPAAGINSGRVSRRDTDCGSAGPLPSRLANRIHAHVGPKVYSKVDDRV